MAFLEVFKPGTSSFSEIAFIQEVCVCVYVCVRVCVCACMHAV